MQTESLLTTEAGVEALKKLVKAGIDIQKQILVSGADGWQIQDALQFIDEFTETTEVFKTGPELLLELKGLNEEGKNDLMGYIQSIFDIPNDKVEGVIEDSISFMLSGISLYNKIKALSN